MFGFTTGLLLPIRFLSGWKRKLFPIVLDWVLASVENYLTMMKYRIFFPNGTISYRWQMELLAGWFEILFRGKQNVVLKILKTSNKTSYSILYSGLDMEIGE